jgi:hypothetical protein
MKSFALIGRRDQWLPTGGRSRPPGERPAPTWPGLGREDTKPLDKKRHRSHRYYQGAPGAGQANQRRQAPCRAPRIALLLLNTKITYGRKSKQIL